MAADSERGRFYLVAVLGDLFGVRVPVDHKQVVAAVGDGGGWGRSRRQSVTADERYAGE